MVAGRPPGRLSQAADGAADDLVEGLQPEPAIRADAHRNPAVVQSVRRSDCDDRTADRHARFSRRINLWDEGYVDSMGVVEIIEYLETTYQIKIPEAVLFSPDFTHIDGIASFVVALKESAA